jgi:sugar phosphate isomerase/epimerase
MKFGILTLQKDGTDQNFSNINLFNPASIIDPVKYVKHALKSGFKNFEITYDINTMVPGIFDELKIKELKDLKDKYNLSYSVHLPLWSVELACPHPYIRNAGVNLTIDAIRTMEALEPETYVLHATGALVAEFLRMDLPPFIDGFLARHMLKFSIEAIDQILTSTGIASRKIAIECIEFPFELMDDMIKRMDLSICLDVGHILAGFSGKITIERFIEKYFSRISELHLHDAYKRQNGEKHDVADHLPLGHGDLDYVWLIKELYDKGYDKRIIFELGLRESLESLKALSDHFDIDLQSNIIMPKKPYTTKESHSKGKRR